MHAQQQLYRHRMASSAVACGLMEQHFNYSASILLKHGTMRVGHRQHPPSISFAFTQSERKLRGPCSFCRQYGAIRNLFFYAGSNVYDITNTIWCDTNNAGLYVNDLLF